MNQRIPFTVTLILISFFSFAQQNAFIDSAKSYFTNYIKTHDVIKGDDIKYFRFFEPDEPTGSQRNLPK